MFIETIAAPGEVWHHWTHRLQRRLEPPRGLDRQRDIDVAVDVDHQPDVPARSYWDNTEYFGPGESTEVEQSRRAPQTTPTDTNASDTSRPLERSS